MPMHICHTPARAGCLLCRTRRHHARLASTSLPQTAEARAAYRRDVLKIPTEQDRFLALMAATAQEHEYPKGDIGVFPTFGVDDNVECEIRVREVPDQGESTVQFHLELQISILFESGFVNMPLPSPWICMDKYLLDTSCEKSKLHAPEWVINSGVVHGLVFFQGRARMLEMVRTQIDLKTFPVGSDGPHIKGWCYSASWTHNLLTDRSIDSITA